MRDCYQLIQDKYSSFPRQQKKIADFILSHVSDVIHYPLARIAEEIGVSNASVVRFAKNLGYRGFPDFRENLFDNYKAIFSPGNRVKSLFEEFKGEELNYKSITEQEILYLQKSITTLDVNAFHGAINMICRAGLVHVMAIGPNKPLGQHLCFRLNRFGIAIKHHEASGMQLLEGLLSLDSDQIALAYDFSRTSEDLKTFVSIMKRNQIPVILVTDILTPFIVKDCHQVLFAERGPHGVNHSPLVPMAITNALLLGVAKKMGDRAFDNLDRLDTYRQEFFFKDREEK